MALDVIAGELGRQARRGQALESGERWCAPIRSVDFAPIELGGALEAIAGHARVVDHPERAVLEPQDDHRGLHVRPPASRVAKASTVGPRRPASGRCPCRGRSCLRTGCRAGLWRRRADGRGCDGRPAAAPPRRRRRRRRAAWRRPSRGRSGAGSPPAGTGPPPPSARRPCAAGQVERQRLLAERRASGRGGLPDHRACSGVGVAITTASTARVAPARPRRRWTRAHPARRRGAERRRAPDRPAAPAERRAHAPPGCAHAACRSRRDPRPPRRAEDRMVGAPQCRSVRRRRASASADRTDRGTKLGTRSDGHNTSSSPRRPASPRLRRVELALMSASMLDRSWEAMLDAAVARGVRQIEACAGGHIPTLHYDPVRLADDSDGGAALQRPRSRSASCGCARSPATATRCTPSRPAPPPTTRTSWRRAALAAQLGVRLREPAGRPARRRAARRDSRTG